MKKKKCIGALSVLLLIIIVAIVCDQKVAYNTKDQLYDNVDSIPHRQRIL